MALKRKALRFKSKFITAELAHLFNQSDSEEEFEGFMVEDNEESGVHRAKTKTEVTEWEDSDMDTGFYSDDEGIPAPKRRSLCVALRFPIKRLAASKPQDKGVKTAPASQRRMAKVSSDEGDEVEGKEEVLSLKKRDKNIQENKAMLAKLFADLNNMMDLTPPCTPHKKKAKTRSEKTTSEAETGSGRRNPSRKARPPEKFGMEEKSEPPSRRAPKIVDIRRLVEVSEHEDSSTKKRKTPSRNSHYVVKPVEDITKEDLDNIAYRSKDKIWDKEIGSSCHQCRQKTLDTKTVCRSGFCRGGKGQFCGPCLKNRYGEDVRTVLLDPTWACPICRGVCNCSLCRKKEGRCATGILVGLARYNGHDNVHQYLESIQKELLS